MLLKESRLQRNKRLSEDHIDHWWLQSSRESQSEPNDLNHQQVHLWNFQDQGQVWTWSSFGHEDGEVIRNWVSQDLAISRWCQLSQIPRVPQSSQGEDTPVLLQHSQSIEQVGDWWGCHWSWLQVNLERTQQTSHSFARDIQIRKEERRECDEGV